MTTPEHSPLPTLTVAIPSHLSSNTLLPRNHRFLKLILSLKMMNPGKSSYRPGRDSPIQ